MIIYGNGVHLVQSGVELPYFGKSKHIYLDFETTSGHPKIPSTNPWHHCKICGICICADSDNHNRPAYYVPIRHYYVDENNLEHLSHGNLPVEEVRSWLWNLLLLIDEYDIRIVGHNIKYDMHVLANDFGFFTANNVEMIDTLTLAKLVDSDRMSYALKNLSKDWLGEDISVYEEKFNQYLRRPNGNKYNEDYGRIPIEVLAEYGGQDVLTTRKLYRYICQNMPVDCGQVAKTEVALTRVIFEEERRGMKIDEKEISITQAKVLFKLLRILKHVQRHYPGLRPHVNKDCYEVLCNQHGLPVLGWTDTNNPSFGKDELYKYLALPGCPRGLVRLMLRYRKLETFNNLFLTKWQELITYTGEEVLHPDNNQCVRTGRRSCKNPNTQQLDKRAKSLIHPREGYAFVSLDYSQIEFRLICHYINYKKGIEAYNRESLTDFHQWVANSCGIPRRPAKNVNFMIAFGGGKGKTLSMLSTNPDLVMDLKTKSEDIYEKAHKTDIPLTVYYWEEVKVGQYTTIKLRTKQEHNYTVKQIFDSLCAERANKVFDEYHNELSTLKPFSQKAGNICRVRGYVRNAYGRHRRLPKNRAHIAFNSIIQSSAADLQKERTVALYNVLRVSGLWDAGVRMLGSVHDSSLLEVPIDIAYDERFIRDVMGIMEYPEVDIQIPIRCTYGISEESWADADAQEKTLDYDLAECEEFGWFSCENIGEHHQVSSTV